MNIAAVADTHAVVWYIYASPRLSQNAKDFIERAAQNGLYIGVSSITLAELVYLTEKGRVDNEVYDILLQRLRDLSNVLTELHLNSDIIEFMKLIPREDIPDFPDRLIAATANKFDVPLITRDGMIRSAGIRHIW
ncbi:MAG: type II toxin-antitoxin system VapC family toxin [Desulfobacteraceae bacterium]|nr:type II toxin-antitoxin system VapC family toxin [Desulfobacteraceae bacterium]